MRPQRVVVLAPVLEQLARVARALEAVQVQAFVPHAAVEALRVGVFHGLPRADEAVLDPVPVGPRVEGSRGEFGTVVRPHCGRLPVELERLVEGSQDAFGG